MISAAQIIDSNVNFQEGVDISNTPGIWCQEASFCGGVQQYQWYGPKGPIKVYSGSEKLKDYSAVSVMHNGQMGLFQNPATNVKEGLYHCVITENMETKHTLVFGVYRSVNYNTNSKSHCYLCNCLLDLDLIQLVQ